MGPTNVALVKLYRADQALREAQERLDAASKNVRVQERRVNDLAEKLKVAQGALRAQQSKAGQLDLDMRSRDAHIEKLRLQQQTAKNNREYQALLIEINTAKVDRGKVEEEALRGLETVEKAQAEAAGFAKGLEAERAKLQALKDESAANLARLQAEVEEIRPARDAAAAALPPKALAAFERLADHHDGEAMAALARPDRRREEYVCTACNMDLVTDVYNKLHSRDELVFCPSCRRILYIPEDLPPDAAIKKQVTPRTIAPRPPRPTRSKGTAAAAATAADDFDAAPPPVIEQRAKGQLGQALTRAQGETVLSANKAGETPVDCEVYVGGELAGIYKGQTPEHLERAVKYFLGEAKIPGDVRVVRVPDEPTTEAADAGADVGASVAGDAGISGGAEVGAGNPTAPAAPGEADPAIGTAAPESTAAAAAAVPGSEQQGA